MKDFCFKFEAKFRGSREEIKERLSFYLPLLSFLRNHQKDPRALDLGCGRGELLELYQDQGIEAIGVDIDPSNVEVAKSLGLQVYQQDILTFLKEQRDSSFNIVSLIHVIEHLEFAYIFEMFKEVSRVLKDGGIFIIETPYVKNLLVGTLNFWLDPTHVRPVHPELIKFLGELNHFIITKVYPLNGPKKDEPISFKNIVHSAQDVSVILVKTINEESYLYKLKSVLKELEEKASIDVEYALERLNWQQESSISRMEAELKREIETLKLQVQDIKGKTDALWYSKPWRVYQFLGKIKKKVYEGLRKIKDPKKIYRSLLLKGYDSLKKRPMLYIRTKKILDKFPRLKTKLKCELYGYNNFDALDKYSNTLLSFEEYEIKTLLKRMKGNKK